MPDPWTSDLAPSRDGAGTDAVAQTDGERAARAYAMLDAVDDTAIFALSPDGRVREWTAAARRALLYTADDIAGQHFSCLHTPESIAQGEPGRWFEAARATGRAEDKGWRVRRDGSVFYASAVMTAITGPDGQPDGFAVVCRDITIQYAAEENARLAEARRLLLADTLHDHAICELSTEGEIREWSRGAAGIFGYSRQEAVGQPLSMLYARPDVAAGNDLAVLNDVRATGQWEGEDRLQRQDGSLVRCLIRAVLLRDAASCPTGILWAARDISDAARLEELEGASRRVQSFLAILAHELRNPLAPIRNAVDVIRLTPALDGRIHRCAEIIGRQIQLLTRLVTDLMDVGRVTAGKLRVQPVPTLYNEIVTAAVEAIRPVLDAAGHSLTVTLPRDPLFVNADAARLGQVLANLLSNATKYTPRGGAISVHVSAEDGNVITAVGDTGQGIAPDALDRIFNLFSQEGEDGSARGGLGIGLALARAVVEAHGGAIQARSAGEGQGSTFTVMLPEVEMDGASVTRAVSADCTGQRILIVDDSPDSADSMAALLTVLGHEARPAYNGMEALALARSFAPDVVLLDLEMPDMSGFEVLAALRADDTAAASARLRVFALTGRGTAEDRRRTKAAGFDDHLVKPLTIDALCQALAGESHN
ncbi:hypothetical protein SAMN05216345_103485 [Cupriavidus sp. YR651]|nr:hypothetical protein SAMN05216345_103485 [Cupriavidus sp. YR651]